MLIGVFFGIAACMIWGCVYVAPLILPDYSPVHIAMMRYLVFGMLAAGLAVPEWRELKSYSAADWRRALALGIVVLLLVAGRGLPTRRSADCRRLHGADSHHGGRHRQHEGG